MLVASFHHYQVNHDHSHQKVSVRSCKEAPAWPTMNHFMALVRTTWVKTFLWNFFWNHFLKIRYPKRYAVSKRGMSQETYFKIQNSKFSKFNEVTTKTGSDWHTFDKIFVWLVSFSGRADWIGGGCCGCVLKSAIISLAGRFLGISEFGESAAGGYCVISAVVTGGAPRGIYCWILDISTSIARRRDSGSTQLCSRTTAISSSFCKK